MGRTFRVLTLLFKIKALFKDKAPNFLFLARAFFLILVTLFKLFLDPLFRFIGCFLRSISRNHFSTFAESSFLFLVISQRSTQTLKNLNPNPLSPKIKIKKKSLKIYTTTTTYTPFKFSNNSITNNIYIKRLQSLKSGSVSVLFFIYTRNG